MILWMLATLILAWTVPLLAFVALVWWDGYKWNRKHQREHDARLEALAQDLTREGERFVQDPWHSEWTGGAP